MRTKITQSSLNELSDQAIINNRSLYIRDTELTNFGARISASGKISYFVELRLGGKDGQNKRVVIGKAPKLSLDEASKQAKLDIGKLANGEDISLRKKQRIEKQKQFLNAKTLSEIFEIWYALRNDNSRYGIEVKRLYDKYVLSSFLGH